MNSLMSSISSKGNQIKWKQDNIWYKADTMGYESLAEVVTSSLLKLSNCNNFLEYQYQDVNIEGKTIPCCISNDFLNEDEILLPLGRLFTLNGYDYREYITDHNKSPKERLINCVDTVISLTNIQDFGTYLSDMLYLDSLILNEDRHLNNIAVIYNKDTKKFRTAPIFDNGLSLLSDLKWYPLFDNTTLVHMEKVRARLFCSDFKTQVAIVDSVYKHTINVNYDEQYIFKCIDSTSYSDSIKDRVKQILKIQFSQHMPNKNKTNLFR